MEQFTASEVRDAIAWKYGDKLTRISAMLHAFADLLEAREKAVPVAYAEFADNGCVRMWSRGYEERLPGTRMVPLYIHSAPSDADRPCMAIGSWLSAALDDPSVCDEMKADIHKWFDAGSPQIVFPPDSERLAEALVRISLIERNRSTSDTNRIDAVGRIAREALAAHSAQAQPPAVSVTDAMVNRMMAEYDAVLCGDPTATRTDGMRAALEAALAPKESGNG